MLRSSLETRHWFAMCSRHGTSQAQAEQSPFGVPPGNHGYPPQFSGSTDAMLSSTGSPSPPDFREARFRQLFGELRWRRWPPY